MAKKKTRSVMSRGMKIGLALAATFLVFALPSFVRAATLTLSPNAGSFPSGNSFTVSVYVQTPGEAMNAASGILSFPTDTLEVISLSKTDSIVNLWVQEPSFSNFEGSIHFEGVVLNPGFTGSSGKIISITFRAKREGKANITFVSGSVLANDGSGTNILTSLSGGSYAITRGENVIRSGEPPAAPIIRSSTHPDPSRWYNAKTAEFLWDVPSGVDGISYAFHTNPNFIPASDSKGQVTTVSYDLTKYSEGAWYFHLKYHNANGWGPTAHRAIKVDYTPPSIPIIARSPSDTDPTNPAPLFGWKADDALSGIAFYRVKVGDGDWFNADVLQKTSSYVLPLQTTGEHMLAVRAYDNAGNASEAETSFTVEPIAAPVIKSYSKKVSSPHEAVLASGDAIPNVKINLYLRKGDAAVVFSAESDASGNWEAQYNGRLSSGAWQLSASAVDRRGAVSGESKSVTVEVTNWFGDLIRFFAEWSGVVALGIILLALLLALIYYLYHRFARLRIKLKKELWKFKDELRKDLKALEADLGELSPKKGGKIDLSDQKFRKTEERLKKEVSHLEDDVKDEIKKIDDLE